MHDDINEVSTPGGGIGARLGRLVSDAIVHTRQQLQHVQADVAEEVFTRTTNHVSDEIRSAMGPLWRKLAEDPNVAPELKPLLHHLGNSRGQAWAWIGGLSASAGLGGGILDLLTNYMNPVVKPIIAAMPTATLTAETAARAAARHLGSGPDDPTWSKEAALSGTNHERFKTLRELAKEHPALIQLLDMVNRDVITEPVAVESLKRQGFTDGWAKAILALRKGEFTLADITALWNRSVIDDDEAQRLGGRVGYGPTQIRRALELGGEPLPPTDLGEAFRRGIIDSDRFRRGIVQGPLRNEWFDVLEALQFKRMTPEAAAEAVNQGHMSLSEGQRIAHEHGLAPEDFATIIKTAGLPPGLEFATEAFNRGLLSDDDWTTMFLESRIKNRYIDLMKRMRVRLIPTETVRLMYREGVYSRDAAIATLKGHGYTDADAAAQIDLEDARRVEGTKDLSRAQVLDLFDEEILEREQAFAMLQALGYNELESNWQLELVEVNKMRRFINLAVGRIRSSYVGQKIGGEQAAELLGQVGVTNTHRDKLLALWDIERETVSQQLTTAQIHWAMRNNLIDDRGAYNRFRARGYEHDDANILVQQGGGNPQ